MRLTAAIKSHLFGVNIPFRLDTFTFITLPRPLPPDSSELRDGRVRVGRPASSRFARSRDGLWVGTGCAPATVSVPRWEEEVSLDLPSIGCGTNKTVKRLASARASGVTGGLSDGHTPPQSTQSPLVHAFSFRTQKCGAHRRGAMVYFPRPPQQCLALPSWMSLLMPLFAIYKK